jgi:hypothetical protein
VFVLGLIVNLPSIFFLLGNGRGEGPTPWPFFGGSKLVVSNGCLVALEHDTCPVQFSSKSCDYARKGKEWRRRAIWTAFELWMELHPKVKRMSISANLCNLHSLALFIASGEI